jgi:hypothetical protein
MGRVSLGKELLLERVEVRAERKVRQTGPRAGSPVSWLSEIPAPPSWSLTCPSLQWDDLLGEYCVEVVGCRSDLSQCGFRGKVKYL